MAKVVGFDEKVFKRFTCGGMRGCGAIVEYAPNEDKYTERTYEGQLIKGLSCPNCGEFHRTNF